eukprot:SAG11_NODE_20529_length_443_cov_1.200581_1_plen_133_part_01
MIVADDEHGAAWVQLSAQIVVCVCCNRKGVARSTVRNQVCTATRVRGTCCSGFAWHALRTIIGHVCGFHLLGKCKRIATEILAQWVAACCRGCTASRCVTLCHLECRATENESASRRTIVSRARLSAAVAGLQ